MLIILWTKKKGNARLADKKITRVDTKVLLGKCIKKKCNLLIQSVLVN